MSNRLRRLVWMGVFVAMLLMTLGCSKLTPDTYDQLRLGMTYDEVVSLLGQPDDCEGAVGFKDCTWGNRTKYINVKFGGNSVVFFSSKGL